MAKIIIKRKKSFCGSAHNFDVYLGESHAGELKNDGQLEIDVDVGSHTLFFESRLKLGKSPNTSFEVVVNEPGEVIEIKSGFNIQNGNFMVEYTNNVLNKESKKSNNGNCMNTNFNKTFSIIVDIIFFFLSILTLLFSVGGFATPKGGVCGVIFMITAILINPIIYKPIKGKFCNLKRWICVIIFIVGFISGILAFPTPTEKTDTSSNQTAVSSNEKNQLTENEHIHKWTNATCEQPSVCNECGETKGEALGHTTDCGICNRCNKEFRKQSPITVLNWRYNIDYVGGVEWNFNVRNNTDKQIKYITMQWNCYNGVGDLIYDNITQKNYVRIRFTGPLNAYTTSTSKRTTTKFYNYELKNYKMSEIIVEYSDGTIEQITQYHDDVIE